MPDDVRYDAVDIKSVIAKGYDVRVTPTLMVFVDNQLKHTASGLLRGDRLQAILARWGFSNRNEDDQPNDADLSDDLNPWSNPRRWERGPIRDRIDDAKNRFAWWLLAKWLGFAAGGVAFLVPWVVITHRALRKLRNSEATEVPPAKPRTRRRSVKLTTKSAKSRKRPAPRRS